MRPQQATFAQIEEFVTEQSDNDLLHLEPTDDIGRYIQRQLELLHSLILGQVSYSDAQEQSREMEI